MHCEMGMCKMLASLLPFFPSLSLLSSLFHLLPSLFLLPSLSLFLLSLFLLPFSLLPFLLSIFLSSPIISPLPVSTIFHFSLSLLLTLLFDPLFPTPPPPSLMYFKIYVKWQRMHTVWLIIFASQEPFPKIKDAKLFMSHAKWANHVSIRSSYLAVLTPSEACQWVCLWRLSLKPSRKLKCYVRTGTHTSTKSKTHQ